MRQYSSVGVSVALVLAMFGVSKDAGAQYCTNNSNSTNCLAYTNDYTSGGTAIWGIQSGNNGAGVEGQDTSTTSPYGYGIWGTTNYGIGVYGHAAGSNSMGVEGFYYGTGGNGIGVYGEAPNAGTGIKGEAGSTAGIGVWGIGGGTGTIVTPSGNTSGVFGTSASQNGVTGEVNNTYSGVAGLSDYTGTCSGVACVGLYGASSASASYGVYAKSPENTCGYAAGYFDATSNGNCANGVAGIVGGTGTGGYFRTYGGYGVYAIDQGSSGSAYGVYATTTYGTGVYGTTASVDYPGVQGVNTSSYSYGPGVQGNSTSGYGVLGEGLIGVYAHGNATGLSADCTGTGCTAGSFSGNVDITGNLTVGSCSGCTSDVRLKKNVEPLSGAIDELLKLKGVTFEWKDPSEHEHEAGHGLGAQTGFIAQDVEKVFPNWVKQDGYTAPDGQKYRTLDLRQIEALEVESIRTLKMQNDVLAERVKELESGREPRISGFNLNGVGFGVGGLAIGLGLIVSRRKRGDDQKPTNGAQQ